jgi:hypothetical protein
MENKSLQKIIDIIRSLHEEGEGGAPTNSTNPPGQINIAGLPPDNPPVKKKKNKYIYGAGFRKNWLQRRNPQP